ncbi:MAG: hypothetical protein ACRENE_10845 [Polyangiaceae bacterium]
MRLRALVAVAIATDVVMLTLARQASATDCTAIVSPCIDDDILWPHAGPSRFVAIGSTETTGSGRLGFGLVATYLSRPVVLHVKTPGGAGSDQSAVDNLVNGTFLWSYGVTRGFELDLAMPVTFFQDGTGLAPVTGGYGLNNTATRDLRFGFTYQLLPKAAGDQGLGVAGRLEVSAPTGDRSQLAAEGWAAFVPSVSADYRVGAFDVAAEVGARIRPDVHLFGAVIGTQMVTALGVGYDVLPRSLLTATLEAWALPTFSQQNDDTVMNGVYTITPNGQHITPAEWQLSARTAPIRGGDLSIQLAGGGALPLSGDVLTEPRFRFTLGIRWAPTSTPTPTP